MRLILICLAALFSAPACAVPLNPLDGTSSTVQPASTCQQGCKMIMNGETTFLRKGQNITSQTNPCEVYSCLENNNLQLLNIRCEYIAACEDHKAPYTLPGACCAKCDYLKSLPFRVNDTRGPVDSINGKQEKDSWGPWTVWTQCSRECGGGRQSRMRKCDIENKAIINCNGDRVQIQDCNTHKCPVHGGWGNWTQWSDCSTTCGNGTQIRTRRCDNPAPMYNGSDCIGESREEKGCFLRHCPVNCVWGAWDEWSVCSVECGGGNMSRTRGKLQVEKYGGQPCQGSSINYRPCNTHFCPIHGGWTKWTQWSDCSKTCSNGTQTRRRSCTNPAPQYGGDDCTGETTQVQDCFLRHCPVHCQWLEFSEWSACSKTCDGGTQQRIRDFVPAKYDGEECMGDRTEVQECNTQECPDPCRDLPVYPCYNQTATVSCKKITDTEFECGACPRGLRGNGRGQNGCQQVDECSEASPCFPGAVCTDLLEGYQCGSCPAGYTGEGVRGFQLSDVQIFHQACEDIDECSLSPNGGCHNLRECENTLGSFVCTPCPAGYAEDGPLGCVFSNPCAAGIHNCQKLDYCVNHAVGQFHCYCPEPLIGNGRECSNDTDLDGVPDTQLTIGCEGPDPCIVDNCPMIPNSGQGDSDKDGIGNACDDDADNDGIKDEDDNCQYIFNPNQRDRDFDGFGDICDNCPQVRNSEQLDRDWDGIGDECDSDRDGDGVLNTQDNCHLHHNPHQSDRDGDFRGDLCDNCIDKQNSDQKDSDLDGVGDACDSNIDRDRDGIQDNFDNCLGLPNSDQLDSDGDGRGDQCDNDDDGDGVLDTADNCPLVSNRNQQDENGNGVGDACEVDTDDDGIKDAVDSDGDRVVNSKDNCPNNKNVFRTDFSKHMMVSLTSSQRTVPPRWQVYANGTEVHQSVNSDPGLLMSYDSLSNLEFTGTVYVDTTTDDDYIGLVFNYQSNRRFMLVSWKQTSQRYWTNPRIYARAGLQIQMVRSNTGPGPALIDALWKTGNTKKQVRLLWHDPQNKGWQDKKAYRWNLRYSSEAMCMTLKVFDESGLFVDSQCVCDKQIKGGRVGLYVFSQPNVIYSNLRYRSLDSREMAELAQCRS